MFPIIYKLDEVLDAINGSPEFLVAERDWGTYINYMMITSDTFPEVTDLNSAIRRECRGIIFCNRTKKIMRRPLHKFFNLNQIAETQLDRLDFSKPHKVYTKLDGSMIVPFEVEYGSGNIRFGTKAGITDTSMNAEVFVANHMNYFEFSKKMILEHGVSPIFEYTVPAGQPGQIVIKYNEFDMRLLAMRDIITGEYLEIESHPDVSKFEIHLVDYHDPVTNPSEFVNMVRNETGNEGYVIAWDNGYRVKTKTDEYCRIHQAKDRITREKDLLEMIVNEEIDDIKSALSESDRDGIQKFEDKFWSGIQQTSEEYEIIYKNVLTKYGTDRKSFALGDAKEMDAVIRQIMFSALNGKSIHDVLVNIVSKNLGTQTKVDEVRYLWKNAKWDTSLTNLEGV
jgi:RNA ligase